MAATAGVGHQSHVDVQGRAIRKVLQCRTLSTPFGSAASISPRARLLRDGFASFAACCFREVHPRIRVATNWPLEVMDRKLAAEYHGRSWRAIVNVLQRQLKSLMVSIAFPAWCLGCDTSTQILCVSYAQDLADKLSRDCRQIVGDSRTTAGSRIKLSPSSRDGHGCGRPLRDRYVATSSSERCCRQPNNGSRLARPDALLSETSARASSSRPPSLLDCFSPSRPAPR